MTKTTLVLFSGFMLCFIILERVRHLPENVVIQLYFKSEIKKRQLAEKQLFVDYLKKFNKSYEKGEFHKRFRYFTKNLKEIRRLNAGSNHANFGLTKFSDWSKEEFSMLNSPMLRGCVDRDDVCPLPRSGSPFRRRHEVTNLRIPVRDRKDVPPKWDWRGREHQVVGPVMDQMRCNVCWALSIVGVMESMAAIQKSRIGHPGFTRLSTQDVIDCSFNSEKDKTGCTLGRPIYDALDFLCHGKYASVTTEEEYPLTFADEDCKRIPGKYWLKSYSISCDMYVDENRLVEEVSRGPVVATVSSDLLANYLNGVIGENCNVTRNKLNHAVQIVGYDTTASPPYYIVRNSWGEDWGEAGYARLAIYDNTCGIAYSVASMTVYDQNENKNKG